MFFSVRTSAANAHSQLLKVLPRSSGKGVDEGVWLGAKMLTYGKCKNFLKTHEFSMMPVSYLPTHKLMGRGLGRPCPPGFSQGSRP